MLDILVDRFFFYKVWNIYIYRRNLVFDALAKRKFVQRFFKLNLEEVQTF